MTGFSLKKCIRLRVSRARVLYAPLAHGEGHGRDDGGEEAHLGHEERKAHWGQIYLAGLVWVTYWCSRAWVSEVGREELTVMVASVGGEERRERVEERV